MKITDVIKKLESFDIIERSISSGHFLSDHFVLAPMTPFGETLHMAFESCVWNGDLDERRTKNLMRNIEDSIFYTLQALVFKTANVCLDDSFKGDTYGIITPPRRIGDSGAEVEPYLISATDRGYFIQENPEYFRCTEEKFIEKSSQPMFRANVAASIVPADESKQLRVTIVTQETGHKARAGWGRLSRWLKRSAPSPSSNAAEAAPRHPGD